MGKIQFDEQTGKPLIPKAKDEDEDEEDFESGEYEIPLSKRKIITQPSDPPISDICDRIDKGKMEARAGFQRKYVWDTKPIIKSKLIESVILDVPIPAIYTADDLDTGKEVVVDGQQRVLTFHGFKNNKFKLKGLEVLKELNGYEYKDLSNTKDGVIKKLTDTLGDLQDLFCNRPIRVIKLLKESHPDIKFEVFERLNRGSVKLNDQELRNCVYRGSFNDLLKELIENKDFWRLQKLIEPHKRMIDAERILRFFAFCDKSERHYVSPLKKFLNDYIKDKRNLSEKDLEDKRRLFKKSVELCQSVFGNIAFRRYYLGDGNKEGYADKKINEGLIDIQLYGFMQYEKRQIFGKEQIIKDKFIDFISQNDIIETIEKGTYGTSQVKLRTEKWLNILREIIGYPENDERIYTSEDKEFLFKKYNKICQECKNKIYSIDDAHVDHIKRFREGGKTVIENGQITHRYCNLHKG